ncbi:hypothetical protein ASPSYDRAFT_62957 [Aspergillus sydowii CBS 593.65]|uniref:BTB domain-containing protein n=1 Tax=Aspergillus sydowii CBS 593.65 TaxID=1036612 RepID=A0A1L9SYF0_9EURO|nr:uncharacterized protein ASPSYDRAFT_62957 [Aspergillus sydowii CBS 593.65]OJJ52157.1 hypothetical protein ASPSYDRAFT_62957 [Aspergillus sydowii CBS 593.65]
MDKQLSENNKWRRQSGTVGFIIGKSRKRFWIHNALTSHFPKKIFNSPVNDEIDEVDFGRCCEFEYTGDYSIPLPTRESHLIEEDKPAWTPLKRWNPTQLSENIFHSTSIDVGRSKWDEDDEPTNPTEDYTEILLAHARVHRVAHRIEWTSLRVLSLYRLTRLLANFTISEDRTGDIVSLLRFVFVESEQMKDIQKLLCDYAYQHKPR